MGIIGGIAATIAAIISQISAAVIAVAAAISAAVAVAGSIITAATSWLVSSVILPIVSATSSIVGASITKTIGIITTIGQATLKTTQFIVRVSKDISESIKAFLNAIHFSTILQIDNIAALVSSEYRDIRRQIFGEISKVSKVLFGTTEFMHSLLLNTRAIILDVSTSMGKTYDLAELSWIETEADILKSVQYQAQKYNQHPDKFLEDINKNWLKPALDLKGKMTQAMLLNLDAIGENVRLISNEADEIRNVIASVTDNVPSQVKDLILPYIDDVTKTFDKWQIEKFTPIRIQLEDTAVALGKSLNVTNEDVLAVKNRIKTPATFIKEIEKLSPQDRQQEEIYLADVSSRAYRASAEDSINDYLKNKPEIANMFDNIFPIPDNSKWNLPDTLIHIKSDEKGSVAITSWVIKDV